MAKASINIKPVSATSEAHNRREVKLDYNFPELEQHNESWEVSSISNREKEIEKYCKKVSGRKLQKNSTPIREGVVNLNVNHTMDDLKKLADIIRERHKIDCFQIHIHRDEGKSEKELNYHAHMVFDWQDKETGKTLKLGRADISQLQDTVSEVLQMERGELKVNSNRKHLEPIEYKRQQEEIRLNELRLQVNQLEQQKKKLNNYIETVNINTNILYNQFDNIHPSLSEWMTLTAELKHLTAELKQSEMKLSKLKQLTTLDGLKYLSEKLKNLEKEVKIQPRQKGKGKGYSM